MKFAKILLLIFATSLAGCSLLQTATEPCKAVKPILTVPETPDGTLRLTGQDAAKLAIYIEQVEACAGL